MPTFKVSSDITVQCNKCKQLKKKKITLNGYYERYSDKEKIHEAYDHAYKELSKTEDKTIAEGIVCSNCERLENFYIYELQPGDRLVADANTGWVMHDAMRVVKAVKDVDVYIEQPCLSYEECLSVRRHTNNPFILDEVIDSVDVLIKGNADLAMDAVNLKISKFGGLTKVKQARDLCVSLGIAMTLEDSWGGDIITAAIAHLAQSTPPEFQFSATDFNSYVSVSIADGAPKRIDGKMSASTAPGLGITPKMNVLGKPVLEVS